jgi:sn-glycerol 3-phosphate transport system permease protein
MTTLAHQPSSTSPRRVRRLKEIGLGYLLVLPALAIFAVFTFYPFVHNFKLAFYQTPPVPGLPSHYVGLHQVTQVLSSSSFLESLSTTFIFVALIVPISLIAA